MKYNLTVLTKRFGNLFFSLSSLISLILTFETLIEIVHHINSDYVICLYDVKMYEICSILKKFPILEKSPIFMDVQAASFPH